jgi:phosphatidylserine/phosphatidylglycerophosphate/cardiolipin synthase-like enzyme
VKQAKKSIDIAIFRFDRRDLEQALSAAAARGVTVRALIANTAGESGGALRKLELRLLEAGLTVARTDDDLVRYHGKYLIVDRSRLFVLGFNFTTADTKKSRSFGVEVRTNVLVKSALDLFEADMTRQPVPQPHENLVVSPVNSRERLAALLKGARRELLIYDPKLSDPRMIRLIKDRIKAGVAVRVLGRVAKSGSDIPLARLSGTRLHVRAIIRDRGMAFIGSQSLKRLELDKRRELGIIVRDTKVAKQMAEVFAADWLTASPKTIERTDDILSEDADVETAVS